jgi:hypothetical protein
MQVLAKATAITAAPKINRPETRIMIGPRMNLSM